MDKKNTNRGPSIWAWIGVTAIVFITAAIVFPMFAKARECARCTSCASNMRQLGLGFYQYAQDYDQKWPGGPDHWAGQIYSYEKSTGVYQCPQDSRESALNAYVCSYAMSANLRGHRLDYIDDPAHTILAVETDKAPPLNMLDTERLSPYTNGLLPDTAWGSVRLGTVPGITPTRHDPNFMTLDTDTHVHLLRPQQVSSGFDNPSSVGAQDGIHAAGTGALGKSYTATFSER